MFQIVLWDNFRDFVSCRCRIVKIDGENKRMSLLLMMLLVMLVWWWWVVRLWVWGSPSCVSQWSVSNHFVVLLSLMISVNCGFHQDTGCLLRGVPEVLSNISLVFGDRDLVFYMKVLYYGTFDNQKMIWPISPTRYFKWLCQKIQRFQKLQKSMAIPHSKRINHWKWT